MVLRYCLSFSPSLNYDFARLSMNLRWLLVKKCMTGFYMLHATNFPAVWTLIDGGEVGVSVCSRV